MASLFGVIAPWNVDAFAPSPGGQQPRALERLQEFEDHPELLERQRAQQYGSDPPRYAEAGDTTAPATPTSARVPASKTRPNASFPWQQFRNQVARERSRIIHQEIHEHHRGRRQTLPFDPDLDLLANAENNIRGDWLRQGIWKLEWGPAWSKDSGRSLSNSWGTSFTDGDKPLPFDRWGHERSDPATPPLRDLASFTSPRTLFAARSRSRSPPRQKSRTTTGKATASLNASASQPIHQFRYQTIKEAQWLRDEPRYERSSPDEIEVQAYLDVKDAWKEWGIWMPNWGPIPGLAWAHEHYGKGSESPDGEADAAANGDEVDDEQQRGSVEM